jgi:hypothetical protein
MSVKKTGKKKPSKTKASKRKTLGGVAVSLETLEAFEAPNGGNPIGAKGVVIGAPPQTEGGKSVFYYVIEQGGKYFYQDEETGSLKELPKLPPAGQAIVRELTNRGALVADIEQSDTGGEGGYCYLLSVENLS